MENNIPDIDKILNAVRQKPATVAELAKAFNLKPDKVEAWAELLEKREFVVIDYTMFGSPKIMIKDKEIKKKEDHELKKEKLKKSRGAPTRTLVIVFLFTIVLISAYYMGLFVPAEPENKITGSPSSKTTSTPLFDPSAIEEKFSKKSDSAIYSTVSEYGDYVVKNNVQVSKGKIRVEWPESGKVIIFDGEEKHIINKDGIVKPINDINFETEVMPLMPWTYVDMLDDVVEEGTTQNVDGMQCTELILPENESLCYSKKYGFPLRYESEDLLLIFKDVGINPPIDESVFKI